VLIPSGHESSNQRDTPAFLRRFIKPFEFWHPRLFELPYYLYLLWRCLIRGLPFKSLAKANYALYHGEIGIGSKYDTQCAFDQRFFLPTIRLEPSWSLERMLDEAEKLAKDFDYPLVLKPDIGSVGKGVVKVESHTQLAERLAILEGPYLLQAFTPFNVEYGVFVVRRKGEVVVTGLNRKHFPTVVGNGVDTLGQLARRHYRYSPHWGLFLKDLDTERVPAAGESVQLSFIGSHTMGCMFTDDTQRLTPALHRAVAALCDSQPGFNFGRLDVKAASEEQLLAGEFVVIEVNGVASLPTHMFDPANSLLQAYRIFLSHGKALVDVAAEHRREWMSLLPWREIISRVRSNKSVLERTHRNLVNR